jgi:hypothetical protein
MQALPKPTVGKPHSTRAEYSSESPEYPTYCALRAKRPCLLFFEITFSFACINHWFLPSQSDCRFQYSASFLSPEFEHLRESSHHVLCFIISFRYYSLVIRMHPKYISFIE